MESSPAQPDDVTLRNSDQGLDKTRRRTVHLGSGIKDELSKSNRRHKNQKQKGKSPTGNNSEESAKSGVDYLDSSDETSSERSSDFPDSAENSPSITRKGPSPKTNSKGEADTNEVTLEIQQGSFLFFFYADFISLFRFIHLFFCLCNVRKVKWIFETIETNRMRVSNLKYRC